MEKIPCINCITLPVCKQRIYNFIDKEANIMNLAKHCSLINSIIFNRYIVKGEHPMEWMTYENVTVNREIIEKIVLYICGDSH